MTINTTKIPPRYSRKIIDEVHTLPVSLVTNIKIIAPAIKITIPIFIGLIIFFRMTKDIKVTVLLRVIIFYSLFKASTLGVEDTRKTFEGLFHLFLCLVLGLNSLFNLLNKKLLILICLEIIFVSIISLFLVSDYRSFKSSYILILFSSIIVIDRVFGLSVLIKCRRSIRSTQSNILVL